MACFICYLLVLFDGYSIDEIVSIHFTHSVLLLFYRHLSYPFLSDFSKIRTVTLFNFSLSLVLLLSISVSFTALLYSFEDKGTLNYIEDT